MKHNYPFPKYDLKKDKYWILYSVSVLNPVWNRKDEDSRSAYGYPRVINTQFNP